MVINRLGYKVSTIGLISKHGFMKLVISVPAGLEEVFVQGKERYDFVGLGCNHERLR